MDQRPKIAVFRGIAGSGKSTALLELYRSALRQAQRAHQPGTTLWLAPTNRAQGEIRARLLNDALPVAFRPNVFTFDQFADEILKAAPQAVAPCSAAVQRILLRRVVGDLLREKRIIHFRTIGRTAGFLDLVLSLIAELKRSETWPEDFSATCQKRGHVPADRELALIYERYQHALHEANIYDGEGRFWSARAALDAGHWGRFARLSLVVLDGFTDFTSAQYKILELLTGRAEQLIVSLLAENRDGRGDLFAKSNAVFERLSALAQVAVTEFPPASAKPSDAVGNTGSRTGAAASAIGHMAANLFVDPRNVPKSSVADGVEVVAVAGRINEVRLLAARVKTLLLEGVAPSEIVVAVRELDEYAELCDEIFTSAGVPIACEAGRVGSRLAPVKALVNLLKLEVEDWPFSRLMSLLDSGFFQPGWSEFDERRAVRDVSSELRRYELAQGREWILTTMTRVAELPTASSEPPVAAQRARDLLQRLAGGLESLRREHDLAGWSAVIATLCRDVGFDGAPLDESDSEEQRTLGGFIASLLFDAARGEQWSGIKRSKLSLPEFVDELVDLLEHQRMPPRHADAGRVRVLSAEQVRNLDIPYLFLAGLTESSFPRHRGDDCIYSERDRIDLNNHGLSLGDRASRSQEELLMFYGIVTRARQRLVLTYPSSTEAGQPLSPTPYLTALRDLFDETALKVQFEDELDPVPGWDRVLSNADCRVKGIAEALAGRPELFRTVCDVDKAARQAVAAVELNVRRFHTQGLTNCEGVLENPRNIEWIRNWFSSSHEFSATQLEAYAACPFRFLMEHVLQLEPPAVPGIETDYARRGSLVHDLLAELHGGAGPALAQETTEIPSGESLAEKFLELLEGRWKTRAGHGSVHQALDRIEKRLLSEWAEAYGRQWDDYVAKLPAGPTHPILPKHTEVAFGAAPSGTRAGKGPARELPAFPPLTFGDGADAIRVGGRIDRIDVGELDGQTMFAVIDYKTGKIDAGGKNSVETGRRLQLAVYALAVLRLGVAGGDTQPWQMGYWYLKETGFHSIVAKKKKEGGGLTPITPEAWGELVANLETQIRRLADGIRQGAFPVYNIDEQCTSHCPYSTVCRVAQIRPLAESLKKTPSGLAEKQ